MVRPKFWSVNVRDVRAIDSRSASDLSAMSCWNRRTTVDFCSGRLSSVLANDITRISRSEPGFATGLSAKFLRQPPSGHASDLADALLVAQLHFRGRADRCDALRVSARLARNGPDG